MKRCPFCAEEIQEDAIKCKHCGEWLEKKDDLSDGIRNAVSKTQDFIKSAKNSYTERKYKHLFVPTANNPLEIKDYKFYDTYVLISKFKYQYSDIVSIFYSASESSTNGMMKETSYKFKITFDVKNYDWGNSKNPGIYIVNLSSASFAGIGGRKKHREKLSFLSQHLHKITFHRRALEYIKEFHDKGYIDYQNSIRIYENGDVEKKNKVVVNIHEAGKTGHIYLGSYSDGRRIQYSNPNNLIIWSSATTRMNSFNSKVNIDAYTDYDCVFGLISNIINSGHISEDKAIN